MIYLFFKSLLSLLHYCYVLVFWPQVTWDLAPWPGIKPAPPPLEGGVLTPGPPGKSWEGDFLQRGKDSLFPLKTTKMKSKQCQILNGKGKSSPSTHGFLFPGKGKPAYRKASAREPRKAAQNGSNGHPWGHGVSRFPLSRWSGKKWSL